MTQETQTPDRRPDPDETALHAPETAANRAPTRRNRLRGPWPAARFLFPPGYREDAVGAGHLAEAAHWIVPFGILIGLLWVGVFRFTWRVFGETGNLRVVPALTVVLVECLLTGPFLAMGLARAVHLLTGDRSRRAAMDRRTPLSPVGTLALMLTVLSQFVFIVSVPKALGWWPDDDWRAYFNFLYPQPIYRPLILAPIWGRWAILLAATIGRPGHDADPATVALCRSMHPARLLRQAVVPMVLTMIYCSRSQNFLIGVVIGLLVFGVTYLVSVAMSRRGGGQTRQTLFAAAQIAQLSFLVLYRAFWSHIHG